jgi:hypothetical protein
MPIAVEIPYLEVLRVTLSGPDQMGRGAIPVENRDALVPLGYDIQLAVGVEMPDIGLRRGCRYVARWRSDP